MIIPVSPSVIRANKNGTNRNVNRLNIVAISVCWCLVVLILLLILFLIPQSSIMQAGAVTANRRVR